MKKGLNNRIWRFNKNKPIINHGIFVTRLELEKLYKFYTLPDLKIDNIFSDIAKELELVDELEKAWDEDLYNKDFYKFKK